MERLRSIKFGRILSIWIIEFIAVLILAGILDGFSIASAGYAFIFVAVLGIVNAFLYPFLVRITLPVTVLTLGIFSLLINAFLIGVAANLVSGISIEGFWTTIWIAIGLSAINSIFSSLFAIDDSDSYYRNVVKKAAQKGKGKESDKPGTIFLEIDGLSRPVMQRAINNAYMPNLARWLRETHKMSGWETDFSAATPACQAGILLGNNDNMPAFRWYDRKQGRLVTMGSPKDSADLEKEKGVKNGLLNGGMSVNNMFSGGASHFVLTSSKLLEKGSVKKQSSLYYFFADPYNFTRTIALAAIDIFQELRDISYQKRQGVVPRVHRGGTYPLIRAITTVIMRDIGIYTIIGEMYSGVDTLYATFVGYDEVAHHAGVERSQAMHTLQQIDKQFEKLAHAAKDAPRPYNIVVLSDHGQSEGITFKETNKMTLEEYMLKLVGEEYGIEDVGSGEEGVSRVNSLLTEIAKDSKNVSGKVTKSVLKSRMKNGVVDLEENKSKKKRRKKKGEKKLVVLVSGNLGLVYFADAKRRLSMEKINALFPHLVKNLLANDGIGFVLMHSEKRGPVVVGRDGTKDLKTGKVKGKDPLEHLNEPNVEKHLIRSSSFANAPDMYINSAYDPGTDQIVPFEEFVGAHGGIGGNQNKPFVMYPKEFEKGEFPEIVGAEEIHKKLLSWTNMT